jgi:hypothetical protein
MAEIHQTFKLRASYDPYLGRAAWSEELSGHFKGIFFSQGYKIFVSGFMSTTY